MIRRQGLARRAAGRDGFTLIELCAVLLIMVVMAGLMMPAFVKAQQEARLRASTRRLLAALNLARSSAVAQQTRARVEIDSDRGVYVVEVEQRLESGEARFAPEVSSLGRANALPEGIRIDVLDSGTKSPLVRTGIGQTQESVTFSADGRADGTTLLLRDPSGNQRVLVIDALTGRTRLEEADTLASRQESKR